MEDPLKIMQFTQIAVIIGLPVHIGSAACAVWIWRKSYSLSWGRILSLLPVWVLVSVALQLVAWQVLPEMPEFVFMFMGFINMPALSGAFVIVGLLVICARRRAGIVKV